MSAQPDEPAVLSLEQIPIDWLERWVCADSAENRRLLRENAQRWAVVPAAEDEVMSGLIQVVTPEQRMMDQHLRFRAILVDPDDPWSDYMDPRQAVLDEAEGIPYWIHRRVEKYQAWELSEGHKSVSGGKEVAKLHKGKEPHLPSRCVTIKKDGTRCWAWCVEEANDGRCRAHAPGAALKSNMGHNIMIARVKAIEAAPMLMDNLEDMAFNAASEQVKLKATDLMLGMAGVSVTTDINMSVDLTGNTKPVAEVVAEKLQEIADRVANAEKLRKPEPEIVDAEVIEDDAQ